MSCEICGESGRYATLAGRVHTYLCHRHLEKWDAYCAAHPTYKRLRQAEIRKNIAICAGNVDAAYVAENQFQMIMTELFSVGKHWILDQQLEEG